MRAQADLIYHLFRREEQDEDKDLNHAHYLVSLFDPYIELQRISENMLLIISQNVAAFPSTY